MVRDPHQLLEYAELIYSERQVADALDRLAIEISQALSGKRPLVLCVMTGGLYFAGGLLSRIQFPLQLDYVHASRYQGGTEGREVAWLAEPHTEIRGRVILILDDILDEGHTLVAIRDRLLSSGAEQVSVAVLAEKVLPHKKPIRADFVGLQMPNRYVFGCGMDAYGWWRNLPDIRALKA